MTVSTHDDVWIFGYGSLMWRPGFDFLDWHVAQVEGWHRALCVSSFVHRGTRERPGLVLGLDVGGRCAGIAFRVDGAARERTIAYLREREQVTSVYLERVVTLTLKDGRRVEALTYVVDRAHPQYVASHDPDAALAIVRGAHGVSGANAEYVANTQAHLAQLGIEDPELAALAERLAASPA